MTEDPYQPKAFCAHSYKLIFIKGIPLLVYGLMDLVSASIEI